MVRTYTPAIRFNGVGLRIAGNRIAHTPHTAITGWSNDHIFENNWIHHTCYASNDCGSFYVGRGWAEQGIVVRFNTFDTVRTTESGSESAQLEVNMLCTWTTSSAAWTSTATRSSMRQWA